MRNKNVAEPFRSIVNEFAPSVSPSTKLVCVDAVLLAAAAEFLASGKALDQITVGGKPMNRATVAAELRLKIDPPPHGKFRECLDANDVRS